MSVSAHLGENIFAMGKAAELVGSSDLQDAIERAFDVSDRSLFGSHQWADGKLLGGAIKSPASQTTKRRPAFVEASRRVIVSGVKQASAENQFADLIASLVVELSR